MNARKQADRSNVSDAHWEHEFRARLHSVPVPEGLAGRVLERLRSADLHGGAPPEQRLEEPDRLLAETNGQPPGIQVPSRGSWTRRRFWTLAASAAAVLLGALLAWWLWPRSPDRGALVALAIELVQDASSKDADWAQDQAHAPDEVMQQLTVPTFAVGYQSVAPPFFAKEARIWKYATGRGEIIYVLEFLNCEPIAGLQARLRLQNTPDQSWSVAAAQIADRTFVVCSLTDLRQWLQPPQVA